MFKNFNVMRYVNIPVFLVSLIIGFLFVYLTMPKERMIYVFPNPENVDILQYKDKTNSCFQYKQTEVSCSNQKNIRQVNPQV
jgi:hypothetical protein